jgi:hypothetical protein
MSVTQRTLDEWVDTLRARCPPPRRTRVVVRLCSPDAVTCDGAQVRGTCARERQTFTIEIAYGMSESETADVLVHEWAHLRTWVWRGIEDDHGPHWGLEVSRGYQALHHTR